MIYEMRTYEVPPGKAPEFLKFYEQHGLAIGTLDSVVFLWGYEDFGHRSN